MIELRDVSKVYKPRFGPQVNALKNINLSVDDYGMVFILGKSGSGKSTLLNVIGGLDKIDSGEIIISGKSSANFSQYDFDSYRNTYLGFIFQEYNILPDYTVSENIGLALDLQGIKSTDEAINSILGQVGLENYGNRKPNELSGGEKQRVAIARALVKNPDIILADEPTGALDSKTALQVFDTLKELSATRLVLIVSHDREFAEQYADRIITLADGNIIDDVQLTQNENKSAIKGMHIVDDSIIHIKHGYTLTDKDTQYINEFLQKAPADTIISIDAKTNHEVRKSRHITETGTNSFVTTKPERIKKGKDKTFQLIKSRLPLKDCIKLGAHALNVKRFRLIMTIVLSVVAFTLFGMADTLAAYNPKTTNAASIVDNSIYSLNISKQSAIDNDFSSSLKMNNDDLVTLKEVTGIELRPIFKSSDDSWFSPFDFYENLLHPEYFYDKPGTNQGSYYNGQFEGILEADKDYIESLGFNIVGNYPNSTNQIAISDYIWRNFLKAGYVNVEATTDSSGTTITQGYDRIPTISGYNDIIGKTIYLNGKNFTVTGVIDTKLNNERYKWFFEPNDSSTLVEAIATLVYQSEFRCAITTGYHGLVFGCNGFVNANSDEFTTAISTQSFDSVIGKMPTTQNEVKSVLSKLNSISTKSIQYSMDNEITMLVRAVDIALSAISVVFVYIAVGFAVFAGLMLANFMSISIINKKKDIGILRAVGAGSRDVFGIFFSESLIIALINFVISTLIIAVTSIACNVGLKANGIIISIFNFGIRQIGVVLAISVLSALFASLLPVWRFARKKPIDTINDR